MLPGFAPDRKPSRTIRPRLQPALHGLADSEILILHSCTDRYALVVIFAAALAHIPEVEIKNDTAMINIHRQHQVGVHVAFVAVDHQGWVLPEIPRAVALARPAGRLVFVRDR